MLKFITFRSLKNRTLTTLLCILSIGLSVSLYLGIERVREGARDGFTNTVSQTDLIVGAKGGSLQLLLYTIFQLGDPTANIRYETYKEFAQNPALAWTIPISLGDNYKGFRVVGTDENFYKHYRFRGDRSIKLQAGKIPMDVFEVAIGHQVAREFGHTVGDDIVLTHGLSSDSEFHHKNTPFKIVAILAPTATPVDRGIYITLHGMEAMHIGWESGMPDEEKMQGVEKLKKEDLEIGQITSFLLRSKSRIFTLRLQRFILNYEKEPLMGIIPAMVLVQLWKTLSYVEDILLVISFCVLLVGMIGIIISLYTSLNERRREMAIFRAVGMTAGQITGLLVVESIILVALGCIFGLGLLYALLFAIRPWLVSSFSVYLPITAPSAQEFIFLGLVLIGGLIAGLIPAIKAYRNTLHDGLTIKV